MSFFSWVIFGALAGWAANLVIGGPERRRQGCLVSVLVGVVGASLGGLIYRMATGQEKTFEWDFPSFGVAVLGAVVLLGLLRLVLGARHRTRHDRS